MTLSEQSQLIRSREDLVAFVKALHKDFRDNRQGWENDTLESFLDALAAWIDDMNGYYRNRGLSTPDQPDWKILGEMLMAARIYE